MDIKSIGENEYNDENYGWSKRRKVRVRSSVSRWILWISISRERTLGSASSRGVIWVIVGMLLCAAFAKLGNAYISKWKWCLTVCKNRRGCYAFYDLYRLPWIFDDYREFIVKTKLIPVSIEIDPQLEDSAAKIPFSPIFRNGVPRKKKTDLRARV